MVYIISQKQRVFDGLKLGCGFLLIVVNCCAACCAAMCVGYMKCLLSLTFPFDVHFQLGLLCKACRNTLFDLCSAWLNCIGPRWCWVVIKAVGCRLMRFLFRHNRSVWCWILITLQFKPEELSDLYSAANMSVCADANITGIFGRTKFIINFNKVHYKISTMVAFCPVVFCPYTTLQTDGRTTCNYTKVDWISRQKFVDSGHCYCEVHSVVRLYELMLSQCTVDYNFI